jgi:dTDP-L-rhamnose 4-epimerase
VTGGAGFIGSHVVDLLINSGYEVTILDCLDEQVHGRHSSGEYANPLARLVVGDVRDRRLLKEILSPSDAVVHLSAVVGIGQSMYQIQKYVDSNTSGTAMLLDTMISTSNSIQKLVVASSMSIYGEGKYYCEKCASTLYPASRAPTQLKSRVWDHKCPVCGSFLSHRPTDEETPASPSSIYAMSKRHQEELSLLVGRIYGIPTIALRFFNVYGQRQALSNPYTGACAIFSNRVLNGKAPFIFEDGAQLRDFVHVRDVARAILLALEHDEADYTAVNIGSGRAVTILELAATITNLLGENLKPYVSNEFRTGDIRHCYADIRRARDLLGFEPSVSLKEGLEDLANWAKMQGWGRIDLFESSLQELRKRRLRT